MFKYTLNKKFSSNFQDLTLEIKKYFQESHLSIHKARNELKILPHDQGEIVVKSFKIPHLLNSFVYSYIRPSKAKRSFLYAQKIQHFTPEPISYIEFYSKIGLLEHSFYLSKKYDYDFTIKAVLFDNEFKNRVVILQAFAKFAFELHNTNIYHHDFSPGNILIKEETDGYSFKIVDLNRMSFFTLSAEDRAKNFRKLWADEETLRIIGEEYARVSKFESINFIDSMIQFTQQDKESKARKNVIKQFFKKIVAKS